MSQRRAIDLTSCLKSIGHEPGVNLLYLRQTVIGGEGRIWGFQCIPVQVKGLEWECWIGVSQSREFPISGPQMLL